MKAIQSLMQYRKQDQEQFNKNTNPRLPEKDVGQKKSTDIGAFFLF